MLLQIWYCPFIRNELIELWTFTVKWMMGTTIKVSVKEDIWGAKLLAQTVSAKLIFFFRNRAHDSPTQFSSLEENPPKKSWHVSRPRPREPPLHFSAGLQSTPQNHNRFNVWFNGVRHCANLGSKGQDLENTLYWEHHCESHVEVPKWVRILYIRLSLFVWVILHEREKKSTNEKDRCQRMEEVSNKCVRDQNPQRDYCNQSTFKRPLPSWTFGPLSKGRMWCMHLEVPFCPVAPPLKSPLPIYCFSCHYYSNPTAC